jgi:hypothetical protein
MPLRPDGLPCPPRRMNTRDGPTRRRCARAAGRKGHQFGRSRIVLRPPATMPPGSNAPGKRRESPRRLV